MPSLAKIRFDKTISRAVFLRKIPARRRTLKKNEVQHCYHAALASAVASWDSYMKSIVPEYLDCINDLDCINGPLAPRFQSILSLFKDDANVALKKFNTPNWDNSRNILMRFTGYDPISDWVWGRKRGYETSLAVKTYLNEILKVRHAFAHGFAVPAFSWTTDRKGQQRLTAVGIDQSVSFIRFLVQATDRGLHTKILSLGSQDPLWY